MRKKAGKLQKGKGSADLHSTGTKASLRNSNGDNFTFPQSITKNKILEEPEPHTVFSTLAPEKNGVCEAKKKLKDTKRHNEQSKMTSG